MPRKALTTPTVRPRARSGTTVAEKGARRRSRSRAVPGSSTAATASDAEDSISTGVHLPDRLGEVGAVGHRAQPSGGVLAQDVLHGGVAVRPADVAQPASPVGGVRVLDEGHQAPVGELGHQAGWPAG